MTSHSVATVTTAHAGRYLQQLCKHWSHKFPVTFTAQEGSIPFGEGRLCDLAATPEQLTITIEATDEATRDRLQTVVVEHLRRFAFREELGEIAWTPAP